MSEIEVRELSKRLSNLEGTLKEALVHIEYLKNAEEKRSKNFTTVIMFAVGALVTAAVTWVITGGLKVD